MHLSEGGVKRCSGDRARKVEDKQREKKVMTAGTVGLFLLPADLERVSFIQVLRSKVNFF